MRIAVIWCKLEDGTRGRVVALDERDFPRRFKKKYPGKSVPEIDLENDMVKMDHLLVQSAGNAVSSLDRVHNHDRFDEAVEALFDLLDHAMGLQEKWDQEHAPAHGIETIDENAGGKRVHGPGCGCPLHEFERGYNVAKEYSSPIKEGPPELSKMPGYTAEGRCLQCGHKQQ